MGTQISGGTSLGPPGPCWLQDTWPALMEMGRSIWIMGNTPPPGYPPLSTDLAASSPLPRDSLDRRENRTSESEQQPSVSQGRRISTW